MSRTQTTETPPRKRRALAAVPEPEPKPAAARRRPLAPKAEKKAATPRPATSPQKSPSPSSPALLALYARFLEAKPPTKRTLANAELERALGGIRPVLGTIATTTSPPIFAFYLAALSECVSQAYGVAGGEGPRPTLLARYEKIVATPMRPTSRRAWAAFQIHADAEDLRPLLGGIAEEKNDGRLALALSALNQALSQHYATTDRTGE